MPRTVSNELTPNRRSIFYRNARMCTSTPERDQAHAAVEALTQPVPDVEESAS